MAKKSGGNIASIVKELAEPVAAELGYFVWDVEYVKEGSQWYLRITIDSEDGIGIEDCEKMHRAIDPILDEADPIEESYHLEVSSPGIERELKNEMQIEACEGWDVEVRLYAPIDGSKLFRGVLLGFDGEGKIAISTENEEILSFDRSAIAKLSTVFDFD
ncbi:MAG: ribosome maturation factor RimP [Eubacteriales bacterium]